MAFARSMSNAIGGTYMAYGTISFVYEPIINDAHRPDNVTCCGHLRYESNSIMV